MPDKELKTGTASLDRIDSSKGYIQGNIQWVHKRINQMKWDSEENDFINWCKLVANHCSLILDEQNFHN